MFERFTDRARRVVVLAQEEARTLNHNYIGTEHVLLGLIHEGEGVAAKALESLGIGLEAVRQQVEQIIGQGQQAPSGHIPFTPRAKKVLELSLREALQLGHNYIGTEHILLGLIREGEGVAAQVLVKLGADLTRVRQQVMQLLGGDQGKEPAAAGAPPGTAPPASLVLDQFGRNLTAGARAGKLDPVIGREKEVERVMQVLCRRTKNNPVLVGEPGVGKTAVVEGLAGRAGAALRDRTTPDALARDHGISRATAHRYVDEVIAVLAAQAPGLRQALERAKDEGLPHVILDGTIIPADRCKEPALSVKGEVIELWYSGKAPARPMSTAATSRRYSLPMGSRCGSRRQSRARCMTSPPPASTPCPRCTGPRLPAPTTAGRLN